MTRQKISEEFRHRCNNLEPYPWQLNVAEALLLGLDCSVIAATGSGKTMPFVMPLFAQPEKQVLIISPLNALEEDQVRLLYSPSVYVSRASHRHDVSLVWGCLQ